MDSTYAELTEVLGFSIKCGSGLERIEIKDKNVTQDKYSIHFP